MSRDPIFIIGAARSGTKFLRDCLGGDPAIFAVPYDVNYIWRYKQANSVSDALLPSSLHDGQHKFIVRSLAQQARLKGSGILLEKTVSNSLRVPFVDAVFPDARFIHLVRDGRDVAASAMKEWVAPPDYARLLHKALRIPFASLPYILWFATNSIFGRRSADKSRAKIWGPRYPGIEEDVIQRSLTEVCALQWKHSVEYALNGLAKIPQERVFTVRYEDLVTDGSEIKRLAQALSLDVVSITRMWETTLQRRSGRPLSDAEKAVRLEIERTVGDTLRTVGYEQEKLA